MASKSLLIILAIVFPAIVSAKKFIVGDDKVFNYPIGAHNVFKVNGTVFEKCAVPPLNEALTAGSDTIKLATSGRKWYICGVAQHCKVGQKLFITVQDQGASRVSSANGVIMNVLPIFTYAAGDHNVLKLNESRYETYIAPPSNEALTSGFDTVNLTTPGRHWYICGKENHCKVGVQKLSIVVQCAEDLPTGANVSPSNGVLVNMVHPVWWLYLGLYLF
ncbi:hypothetical protein L1049_007580 [Liquidambar formosana]|uniref:Phytocyanin domain-containing protein n=1 Tax=Liquidambar formosana TaxID=63359 RepID=A0AAP0S223_LIQFO